MRIYPPMNRRAVMAGMVAALAMPAVVRAQGSGAPVRIVVGQDPGGFPDRVARVLAQGLSSRLNRSFFVENRPGAGGQVASAEIAGAASDGTHLLVAQLSSQVLGPLINPVSTLDAVRDLSHIAYIGGPSIAFAVPTNSELTSFEDVLEAGKTRSVTYGTGGVGTLGHLMAEYVASNAGLDLFHIPYAGPRLLNDLMLGDVELASLATSTALAHQRGGGDLRVLAIATEQRLPGHPDIPVFKEFGFDLVAINWLSLSGPLGLPADYVAELNEAVAAILADPANAAFLEAETIEPRNLAPDEVTERFLQEREFWSAVVEENELGGN